MERGSPQGREGKRPQDKAPTAGAAPKVTFKLKRSRGSRGEDTAMEPALAGVLPAGTPKPHGVPPAGLPPPRKNRPRPRVGSREAPWAGSSAAREAPSPRARPSVLSCRGHARAHPPPAQRGAARAPCGLPEDPKGGRGSEGEGGGPEFQKKEYNIARPCESKDGNPVFGKTGAILGFECKCKECLIWGGKLERNQTAKFLELKCIIQDAIKKKRGGC